MVYQPEKKSGERTPRLSAHSLAPFPGPGRCPSVPGGGWKAQLRHPTPSGLPPRTERGQGPGTQDACQGPRWDRSGGGGGAGSQGGGRIRDPRVASRDSPPAETSQSGGRDPAPHHQPFCNHTIPATNTPEKKKKERNQPGQPPSAPARPSPSAPRAPAPGWGSERSPGAPHPPPRAARLPPAAGGPPPPLARPARAPPAPASRLRRPRQVRAARTPARRLSRARRRAPGRGAPALPPALHGFAQEWDWFQREELIGRISDIRGPDLQVARPRLPRRGADRESPAPQGPLRPTDRLGTAAPANSCLRPVTYWGPWRAGVWRRDTGPQTGIAAP